MPGVTIWTLESDYDAKAVEHLAQKLKTYQQLGNLRIRVVGNKAIPRRPKNTSNQDVLRSAVRNYLKQDDGVIFILDTDGPMTSHQRRQEPNSLINQVKRVVSDSTFEGKVHRACAVPELEAWLLVDCLGIFCYYASQRKPYSENCREKVSQRDNFLRVIARYQVGDTERIVEAEKGGKGAKEHLREFSEEILSALNPAIPPKNVRRHRYDEARAPGIAEHVAINAETLRRNNSLMVLGDLLLQLNSPN